MGVSKVMVGCWRLESSERRQGLEMGRGTGGEKTAEGVKGNSSQVAHARVVQGPDKVCELRAALRMANERLATTILMGLSRRKMSK